MPSHNPYQYAPADRPRIINWPKIILITLAVIVIIAGVYLAVKTFSGKRGDNAEGNVNGNNSAGSLGDNTYDCSSDVYNCDDFTTQAEAQEAFDQCSSQGFGDIHQLDRDGNGKVCEGLE